MIADMVAKAPLLFKKQFNGKFCCPWCYELAERIECGFDYKRADKITLRASADFKRHGTIAQATGCVMSVITGRTPWHKVLENIPFSVPFDLMHQVFLGVARKLLE